MFKKIIIVFSAILFFQCTAQKTSVVSKEKSILNRPKLVVGIVVDQMRYDYLIRFYNKYGENGFKRLMNNGFICENTHYNYIPTYTAVGHTSIYTGTTPSVHGIISNNWYDKFLKKSIYCVDDNKYKTIGALSGGAKSPYRLQTTTISDQLKLAQHNKGKVIGISLKDRAAILPTGHTADAAYWFKGNKDGNFITSSFYLNELPRWVKVFNHLELPKKYANSVWKTKYDINTYTESIEDNNAFEGIFKGEKTPTLPRDLAKLNPENKGMSIISYTPFGNNLVRKFAQAAIEGEKLGTTNFTDFLAISFSSTDYIGHKYGVDSKEIEDTYIRLDDDIAKLLLFLDTKIGKDNYTLFLTADHAAVPVPSYLKSLKIQANYFDVTAFKEKVKSLTMTKYGSDKIIENISNYQLFLNHDTLNKLKLDENEVTNYLAQNLIHFKGVYKTVTAQNLQNRNYTNGVLQDLQNGYNQKFSGDVFIIPTPATIIYSKTGSTHGSGYNYDTHVPLLFYGKGINKGNSKRYTPITDIAPTISNLLQIESPNGTTGEIIEEVLKD